MSDAGRALRERFAELRKRIVVPEFKGIVPDDSNGDPAIYCKPFTIGDSKGLQRFIDKNDPEGFALLVIRKSFTEDDEKIFQLDDKDTLCQYVEAEVISRIGALIVGEDDIKDPSGN